MEHTPGPWTVTNGNDICGADYPGRGLVARVNVHRGEDDAANARLIAAAPDMLEALQAIADGHVMYGKVETYSHADVVLAYQELARKAIAKARPS